jgi:PadR family transcriptional regulator PadR
MPKSAMPDREARSDTLIRGTLEMLILRAISRGKTHGYAMAEWIHAVSDETLHVEEGALYPALHRLELRGMLDSEWGVSDANRRVKFYRLTKDGRRFLTSEQQHWEGLVAGMMRVLKSS